jgi:hypothetical protein
MVAMMNMVTQKEIAVLFVWWSTKMVTKYPGRTTLVVTTLFIAIVSLNGCLQVMSVPAAGATIFVSLARVQMR